MLVWSTDFNVSVLDSEKTGDIVDSKHSLVWVSPHPVPAARNQYPRFDCPDWFGKRTSEGWNGLL